MKLLWMRFKSFNDRFEIVFPCTTNFMFICHCETLSKAVAAFVKYCQKQSVTDCRELYLICHIMDEISLNVNVNLNVNVKIYGIVVDGIVTRHCRGRNWMTASPRGQSGRNGNRFNIRLTRLYYSNDTEYELDLFLLIFWRRICLVYKYKHNSEL